MKKNYFLAFLLTSIFSVSHSFSQCSFDSNDSGFITDANFVGESTPFNTTTGYGNSWTACGNGILNKISILAINAGQTATIGIYSGAGTSGNLLGTATATTTTATSINDRNLVFDFSSSSISLTSGATYTWAVTSGSFDTRPTNSNIYNNGSTYSDTFESNVNDFLFKVDITNALSLNNFESSETVIKLFPNPSSDYIQVSGLTKTETYTVYNVLGAKVNNGVISNNENINIENLTNGIYLLKLKNGSSIKFIKK